MRIEKLMDPMTADPGIDVDQLRNETLLMISALELLVQEIKYISRPFEDQIDALMFDVNYLDEKQKLWEGFIKERIVEYHLGTEVSHQLAARVQITPDIERDWLKDYYARHPDSFLNDYVTIKPFIAFSSRLRPANIPFSSLQAKFRHNQAIETAQELVAEGYVAIDTETTGLTVSDQIVSIAVIGRDDVFYSLIKPTCPISPAALQIHHITEEMVADAPTLAEVMPAIQRMVQERRITAFNAPFDKRCMEVSARARGIQPLQGEWTCSMHLYRQFADLLNHKLESAARSMGLSLDGSLHNAETDARLAYDLIEGLSKGERFEIDAPIWERSIPLEERAAYVQQRLKGLDEELNTIHSQKQEAEKLVSGEVKMIQAQQKKAVEQKQADYNELLVRAKKNVAAIAQSVKGKTYQLLYYSRLTWDINGILKYIYDHPRESFSRLAANHIKERTKVTFPRA
jgi:DNA polymerase-3 subunit epsilon